MKNSSFHVDEMSNNITRKLVVNMLCSVAVLLDGCVFFFFGGGKGRGEAENTNWEQTGRLTAAVNVNVACSRTLLGMKRRWKMCLTVTRD
jgi:hypothetical protein